MGGEGTVMMERLLDAPAEMLGKGRAYVRHTLAPGVTIGRHTHEHEMESMVIVSGRAVHIINGEEQTIAAHEVTKALLGEDNVRIIRPFMSSEDFSEYLNRIPGAIIRVGIRDEEHQVSLHNQQMDFNDEVLPVAVSVVANMAVRRLEALAAR